MGFIVLTKEPYDESYRLTEVDTLPDVERIIRDNFASEVEVRVAIPVDFSAGVVVKIHPPDLTKPLEEHKKPAKTKHTEEGKSETEKSQSDDDKGPGDQSNEPTGSGD